MNMNQALVVLGETHLKNRLLEDENEQLRDQLEVTTTLVAELKESVESLRSEKGVLLTDISELEAKLEKKKEGGNG